MAHVSPQPPGVCLAQSSHHKPIIRVVGGDTWDVSVNLYDPSDVCRPASPETTFATVTLSETQFDRPIWTGEWNDGIMPDVRRKDLFHIVIPREVTASLRRGSYQFSVRLSDLLKTRFVTEAEGSFLVEYKPTSDQHSIPYKDGTSEQGASSHQGCTDYAQIVIGGSVPPVHGLLWIDLREDAE